MSAPLTVNTKDGTCWTRRAATRAGLALYAPEGVCSCPELVMATEAELAELGIVGSADVLPVPVGPLPSERDRLRAQVAALLEERHSTNEALDDAVQELRADRPVEESSSGGFPPALPWLALLDEDDRVEFLDDLGDSATVNASSGVRLAEVERTCGTWRLIAEAQHGHETAPGPDAMSQVFAPVASLRELGGPR